MGGCWFSSASRLLLLLLSGEDAGVCWCVLLATLPGPHQRWAGAGACFLEHFLPPAAAAAAVPTAPRPSWAPPPRCRQVAQPRAGHEHASGEVDGGAGASPWCLYLWLCAHGWPGGVAGWASMAPQCEKRRQGLARAYARWRVVLPPQPCCMPQRCLSLPPCNPRRCGRGWRRRKRRRRAAAAARQTLRQTVSAPRRSCHSVGSKQLLAETPGGPHRAAWHRTRALTALLCVAPRCNVQPNAPPPAQPTPVPSQALSSWRRRRRRRRRSGAAASGGAAAAARRMRMRRTRETLRWLP